MLSSPLCKRCLGIGWVCETHPDKPWAKQLQNGCECGPGVPCPDCNDLADGSQPRTDQVITSVDATRELMRRAIRAASTSVVVRANSPAMPQQPFDGCYQHVTRGRLVDVGRAGARAFKVGVAAVHDEGDASILQPFA
jgi:ribosomal protein L30E